MEAKSSPRERLLWAVLCLAGLLLLFAGVDCDGTPVPVIDQVRPCANDVWAGDPDGPPQLVSCDPECCDMANPPVAGCCDWHPLSVGDVVRTNDTGEAELTLEGCLGHMWVFTSTNFGVYRCDRETKELGACLDNGDAAANMFCTERWAFTTDSCTIVIEGTVFSVSYLPKEMLTLVAVVRGTVVITPVLNVATRKMASQSVAVGAGQWAYSIPGEQPRPIAGQPARTALPLDSLPILVDELGIRPRFDRITNWILLKEIEAPTWPFRPEIGLVTQGELLEKDEIRDALLGAIDFQQVLARDVGGTDRIAFSVTPPGRRAVDAYTLKYDPAGAKERLASYQAGLVVYVVHPEGDRLLAAMAGRLQSQLRTAGLQVKAVPVPAGQIESYVKDSFAPDVVTLWLQRR